MTEFIALLQQSALAQYYLAAVLCVWPVLRTLKRMGLPALCALLLFVPLMGFAFMMLLMALRKWPHLPPQPPRVKRARHETGGAA